MYINVGVPRENLEAIVSAETERYIQRNDLPIPPPAKKRSMHYPCLNTDIRKSREVCLHQIGEDSFSLVIVEFMVCETNRGSALLFSTNRVNKVNIPAIVVRMKATEDIR